MRVVIRAQELHSLAAAENWSTAASAKVFQPEEGNPMATATRKGNAVLTLESLSERVDAVKNKIDGSNIPQLKTKVKGIEGRVERLENRLAGLPDDFYDDDFIKTSIEAELGNIENRVRGIYADLATQVAGLRTDVDELFDHPNHGVNVLDNRIVHRDGADEYTEVPVDKTMTFASWAIVAIAALFAAALTLVIGIIYGWNMGHAWFFAIGFGIAVGLIAYGLLERSTIDLSRLLVAFGVYERPAAPELDDPSTADGPDGPDDTGNTTTTATMPQAD